MLVLNLLVYGVFHSLFALCFLGLSICLSVSFSTTATHQTRTRRVRIDKLGNHLSLVHRQGQWLLVGKILDAAQLRIRLPVQAKRFGTRRDKQQEKRVARCVSSAGHEYEHAER